MKYIYMRTDNNHDNNKTTQSKLRTLCARLTATRPAMTACWGSSLVSMQMTQMGSKSLASRHCLCREEKKRGREGRGEF